MEHLQNGFAWHCYGCGQCNERGLKARTVKTRDGYLCQWHPGDEHVAHPGKTHHGLITTICFCHGAWAATAERYHLEGKTIEDPLEYFYVNRSINYEIDKPIAVNSSVSILADVSLGADDTARVGFEIRVDRDLCAVAETTLVRVHATTMAF